VEQVDCVVIGAGVIGLAVARALARAGREVIILERAAAIGTETSSRNSEVIHAGIYYPAGSLRACLCVEGKHALYRYCDEHGVAYKRLGKLIVATSQDEVPILEKYQRQAAENGVSDLTWLAPEAVRELEPNVRCVRALHSPSTGVIDSHGLMLALLGDAEARGTALALRSEVLGGELSADGIVLHVGGAAPMSLRCALVVNCAGLHAQDLARSLHGVPPETIPPIYYAIGHYFTLGGKPPFTRLIYPVAVHGSLGLHVALDLAGQVRFGPDIHWIDRIDYSFDASRAPLFYESVRRYYPDLRDGALQPGYTGIRPKLFGPNELPKDFLIQDASQHGVRGLINLYGIDSPGLTSSLAIAQYVGRMAAESAVV
jgi:L-2-hydroxyglutarate oxidase LhgO